MQEAGFPRNPTEQCLRSLGRREWWLWVSALSVTLLATLAFLLSSLPFLFGYGDHFYEIRPDQAERAAMSLLLLFNSWLVYRQWFFRRLRRQGAEQEADLQESEDEFDGAADLDLVTGFYTPASAEQRLGKEITRSRREKTPLSLIAVHLDDFGQLTERYGAVTTDLVLNEFARRLRKAIRGSDFVVRLKGDDFLLVLPECGSGAVKLVLDRLGSLEMECSGKSISLTYSTQSLEHQSGESSAELMKRAVKVLQLYGSAASDASRPVVLG